ncbi:hypothetical protein GUITHDRAFT_73992 [Guillardia theta CCMP2712]|uniref:RING-type domain-containing protein n=1 Tax=Guillardia theta (strain CCMP2712) TaxID=905079 RepID=L1J2K7_GUITC|nr:hypothetical protein GUITHDRAFT_73992 [Guillardia theta CCMP2712]EKX42359.1 hypothetical protein GUITHDRAFT_73992 [Guillardia theta CCMP2712]|eukprot:XP_005829339.1 hypothetical protein GUITHDRAFT_73992 [Guillardia theta CCMP2712]
MRYLGDYLAFTSSACFSCGQNQAQAVRRSRVFPEETQQASQSQQPLDDFAPSAPPLEELLDDERGDSVKQEHGSSHRGSNTEEAASGNNQGECVICLEAPSKFALMPCGHLCLCGNCVGTVTRCPLCRKELQGFLAVYT